MLFGKTRGAVLGLLYGRPDEALYMRQIIRLTALSPGSVKRELDELTEAELITREARGKQVFFQANVKGPLYDELRRMLLKTVGAAGVIRAVLLPLAGRIRAALIYGSAARGAVRRASDIDLMVVGDVKFGEVSDALCSAEDTLGREVNPVVYPIAEFQTKLRAKHYFVSEVMAGEKVFLFGDSSELERLG
jgi:predicted nucleotidyltransferase